MIFFLVSLFFNSAYAVHDENGKTGCLECHLKLPFEGGIISFSEASREACTKCHESFHGREEGFLHPVNVIPSVPVPPDLPLDKNGRLTCITCHSYHSGYQDADGNRGYFLRRVKGKTFCYSCHSKRLISD